MEPFIDYLTNTHETKTSLEFVHQVIKVQQQWIFGLITDTEYTDGLLAAAEEFEGACWPIQIEAG